MYINSSYIFTTHSYTRLLMTLLLSTTLLFLNSFFIIFMISLASIMLYFWLLTSVSILIQLTVFFFLLRIDNLADNKIFLHWTGCISATLSFSLLIHRLFYVIFQHSEYYCYIQKNYLTTHSINIS